jgi:hypothetical protein
MVKDKGSLDSVDPGLEEDCTTCMDSGFGVWEEDWF